MARKDSEESIAICMAIHNNASTLVEAIRSVVEQIPTRRTVKLILSDDNSTDDSVTIARHFEQIYPNIYLNLNTFNNASANRNWLQNYIKEFLPGCILMGRLDADDMLSDPEILSKIENLWDCERFDVVLMSNYQILDGKISDYINRPQDLLNGTVLLDRLKRMSEGIWEAELPSCNVFVRPEVCLPYPDLKSAEDHWNLVDYLLKLPELKILIRPEWIYCNYRIDHHFKKNTRKRIIRQKSRKELYKYAFVRIREKERIELAAKILNGREPGTYSYLGAGFSGVVFHDGAWVYKVHIPVATNNFNEVDNILFLKEKLDLFQERKHFYPLRELTLYNGYYILIYSYEKGEQVNKLSRADMISFLTEMWEMKVICRSITKENNFIRVNQILKLIDYEIEPYNDNLFLNLAARAFIQLDDSGLSGISYNKLKRSTINNFNLQELSGFFEFCKAVFAKIANIEDPVRYIEPDTSQFIDKVEYSGDKGLSVSLLIKVCVQDSLYLFQDVSLLVKQLSKGIIFKDRILLLDMYKEDGFLRQFTENGTRKELLIHAQNLKLEGIITDFLISPEEREVINGINYRWFSFSSSMTHTSNGVPVTSQLYAFESIQSDYILQMDVDVLVGTKQNGFDYLKSRIEALSQTPSAVSIGFQIFHEGQNNIQEFTCFAGDTAPDVRCSLLDRQRLLLTRPLPNSINEDGWELSWYRSLERHQKKKGLCSLRGGPSDTFYLHIQNYRKVNRKIWWRIQQGIKNGFIPEIQSGKPEIAGTHYDWCLPKRSESLVVILYLEELDNYQWQNTIRCILNQNYDDLGILLIDNTGYQKIQNYFQNVFGAEIANLTLVCFEKQISFNEAIYDAIHYYLDNQDSFICLMKQGDYLLYDSVFSECMNRLETYIADVLLGKELSSCTLEKCGISVSDFLHPRNDPGSLSNGLFVFRKYLFDALDIWDLKQRKQEKTMPGNIFSRVSKMSQWLNDNTMLSIIVPIIELSSNPIRFDNFNVFRERAAEKEDVRAIANFLGSRKPKTEGCWEKGRKTFKPNFNRIELDITYDCNLKCRHCNRSCSQAPTKVQMSMEQLMGFVHESIVYNRKWELINILGGEPTLHPQFNEIVNYLLSEYIVPFSPKTILQITSNGFGEMVRNNLYELPVHPNIVIDKDSFKNNKFVPYFTAFNLAPCDEPDSINHEYHKGCWVTSYCGIGLNHLGYFVCGVAGGMERILKSGLGAHSIDELSSLTREQFMTYCRYCGNYTAYEVNHGDFMERAEKDMPPEIAISNSWKRLYNSYNDEIN